METKAYLGDSVYCVFDGYGLTLTTENGGRPSNTIYMEPSVLAALNAFVARLGRPGEVDRIDQEVS